MNFKSALIKLPRRSNACQKCGQNLLAGSNYFSTISSDKLSAELQRSDYCHTCSAEPLTAADSHWKSTIAVKKTLLIGADKRLETALGLLLNTSNGSDEPLSPEEAFFLALYLARKRILLFKKEIDDAGVRHQLFEVVDTEEMLAVKKVDFNAVDAATLQKAIAKKLGN